MIRVVELLKSKSKALIVVCMGFDWGDCVINDPASDQYCASSKCTTCCASVSSACISTSITPCSILKCSSVRADLLPLK